MGEMEYWTISTGPRQRSVGGGMYKKIGQQDGPRNYIAVDEIDEAIATFTGAGGKELVGKQEVPGFGWSFLGSDPEGNVLGMFQAASETGAKVQASDQKSGEAQVEELNGSCSRGYALRPLLPPFFLVVS